jgi:hypothetical protein
MPDQDRTEEFASAHFEGDTFVYRARCERCLVHREISWVRHSWIPGRPETERVDCPRCRERDAIKDGSVQLALIKYMLKQARQIDRDLDRIADCLTPAMRRAIVTDLNAALAVLGELGALLRRVQDSGSVK